MGYPELLLTTMHHWSKVTSDRPKLPWYNDEIGETICRHHKAEWVWKNDITNTNKFLNFYRHRRKVTNLLNESEHTYYKNILNEAKQNSKKIFKTCNSLLGWNTGFPLPPGHSDNELAECFNTFFISKISRIRSGLEGLRTGPPDEFDVNDQILPCMDCFEPLSQEEVENIINTSPNKSCDIDPILTTLLKEILLSVITILTGIINKSLTSGIFPQSLKVDLVKPLLKKANLDLIENNYRPVSNIEFIGKSIERAAIVQLTRHITNNNLIAPHQSAYWPCHGTEMALLKVKSDLITAIENQEIACLVLLDLSAAFDMVNNSILLQQLTNLFGITSTVKTWIALYLTNWTQKVKVGSSESSPVTL